MSLADLMTDREHHKHVFISFIQVKNSVVDTSSLILRFIFLILTELIDLNIQTQRTAEQLFIFLLNFLLTFNKCRTSLLN